MLGWILAGILLLPLLLVLATPFTAKAAIAGDGRPHFKALFSWLLGFINFEATTGGGALKVGGLAVKTFNFSPTKPHPGSRSIDQDDRGSENNSGREIFSKVRHMINKELINLLVKTMARLWKALSLKVEGQASLGFADPSLTGMAYGLWEAGGLPALNPGLKISPNFMEAGFFGLVQLSMRFTAGKMLFIIIRLLLSRQARRLWRPLLRRKEVNKEWRNSAYPTT